MGKQDGGLRAIFRKNLKGMQLTPIETGSVAGGVPDSSFAGDGVEGFIEFKRTSANAVKVRPLQVGWIERRLRMGGRVFVAVVQKKTTLVLLEGRAIRPLKLGGLEAAKDCVLGRWEGGEANWDWREVRRLLIRR